MARDSAYSGKMISWDEMAAASLNYVPENPQLGSVDMTQPLYQIPVPGVPKSK